MKQLQTKSDHPKSLIPQIAKETVLDKLNSNIDEPYSTPTPVQANYGAHPPNPRSDWLPSGVRRITLMSVISEVPWRAAAWAPSFADPVGPPV